MNDRTNTTPTIYYATKSIVGGLNVFSTIDPVVVYVKHECDMVGKFEAGVDAPRHFVVFNSKCVSCFWRQSWKDVDDTGWTLSTGDVDVTLEVLPIFAITHPPNDVDMIFKLLYTSIYYIRVIRCQHSKLTGMHRQPNIQLPCNLADPCKMLFAICDHSR